MKREEGGILPQDGEMEGFSPNDPVHRAAANDFPFQNRAARGSVCNGLFAELAVNETPTSRMPLSLFQGASDYMRHCRGRSH